MSRWARLLAIISACLFGGILVSSPAKADPGRNYCFVAPNVFEYKGVTNEPTEDTLISPNGSFTDGQDWNGAYSTVDPTDGVCLGKLPPGSNDNLVVGTVSNGTTFVSTTIGGGGGSYASLLASGQPPSSGVTLTLDTNGSAFAGNVIAQTGQITFQGGLSSGGQLQLTNIDQQNPAQYTVAGGTYSAATAIYIGGAMVTAPSGAALQAPEVHIDGDLELGGKLAAANFLTAGEFGVGTLNIQSGAAVTSGNGFIGAFANSSGNVTVNGKWTLTGELIDGQLGNGSLTVGQGGQVTTGDFMTVGAGANTLSTLTINGGGTVSVTAKSGLPTDLALNTAVDPASLALVSVDGAGSKLTIGGALNVGYEGTATMEVSGGAAVTVTGSIVRIGRLPDATGTLDLTGGSSSFTFANGTIFQLGDFGTGNLNVTGGFHLNTGRADVILGALADSQGTALVSDPGSTWTTGGGLFSIGEQGFGSLTVSNGGRLDISSSGFALGDLNGGVGDLTLSGAQSSIVMPSAFMFDIGVFGHGNLVLNQGFNLDTGAADIVLGAEATAVGFASLSGVGTSWKIGGDLTIGDQGKGELDVTTGAALTFNGGVLAVGNTNNGGKLVLSDATSTLTMPNAQLFVVGAGGNGEVDVGDGFQLDTGKTGVVLGGSGGVGEVELAGSGTNWTMGGSLAVGLDGTGLLAVSNGATLTVSPGATVVLGAQAGSKGFLTLDGATSTLVASEANIQIGGSGAGTLALQDGAMLDWSNEAVTLGMQQGSSGTINVNSGATFTVGKLTVGGEGLGDVEVGDAGTKGTLTVTGDTMVATGDASAKIAVQSGSQATFDGDLTLGVLGNSTLTLAGSSSALVKGDLTAVPDGNPSVTTIMVNGGSTLTVNGALKLNASLDVDASTVDVDGGLQMGDMVLTLKNGSTFNSTSSSLGADFAADLPGKIEVMSGSHMTLASSLFSEDGSSPLAVTVDGNSTLTATTFNSSVFGPSSLTITGGSQVSFTGKGCSCAALIWTQGAISVSGGSMLTAPTATIGMAGLSSSLTLMTSGAAAFSNNLMLQPGSTLDVTGGGIVVVGAPSSGGSDQIGITPGGGQVLVGPGGILKGVAGGAPATVNGNVQINAGGLLAGTLNINGKVVNVGVHLLGDDPSTVTVNGSYTLGSTGTIIAEVGPASYSQLVVNGPVTLNGGTLEFEPVQGGVFQLGKTYSVLSAAGGVTGNFADVTVAPGNGTPFIELMPDFVDGELEVTAQHMPGSFAAIATTPNQHAVASALDQAPATGALGDLVNALSNEEAPSVIASLDPLSGEAYGDFAEAGMQANRDFAAMLRGAAAQTSGRDAALTAFSAPRQPLSADGGPGDPSVWMTAVGALDHLGGLNGAHTVRDTAGGLAAGLDFSPSPHWALGGGLGYLYSNLGAGQEGSGALNTYQAAAYGAYSGARAYVEAAAGYARGAGDLHRSLAPAAGMTAEGRIQADQYFASTEAGADLTRWDGMTLTPFAALDALRYDQKGSTETGAAGLGLAVEGRSTDSLQSELGLQVSMSEPTRSGRPLAVALRLGWGHEFAQIDRSVTAAFIAAPGTPFAVEGAPAARDFAVIGLGVDAKLDRAVNLSARYDADISGRTSEQRLSLDARVAW